MLGVSEAKKETAREKTLRGEKQGREGREGENVGVRKASMKRRKASRKRFEGEEIK